MPAHELIIAALAKTTAFSVCAMWQGLHQQYCDTGQESCVQQCRWEVHL